MEKEEKVVWRRKMRQMEDICRGGDTIGFEVEEEEIQEDLRWRRRRYKRI